MLKEQDIKNIIDYLQNNLIPYKENLLLKYETYFKSGGMARIFVEPFNIPQVIILIQFLRQSAIDYKVIGATSNIYFLDELNYSVIITTRSLRSLKIENNLLEVESGYPLESFVRIALMNDAIGFEGLEGIPGSIGGAIFMNAGAYGFCISDKLVSVTVLNDKDEIQELTKQDCHFTHRSSMFKENAIYTILSAKFALEYGEQTVIADSIRTYHIARHSYQEFAYPNLGSLFSVQGDFYRELFRNSPIFKLKCTLYKILLRNPISKWVMRRNPNNRLLNNLVIQYLSSNKISLPISEKSINILINNGKSNFFQKFQHIHELKKYLKNTTPIENEFVFLPLMDTEKNTAFLKQYQEIVK